MLKTIAKYINGLRVALCDAFCGQLETVQDDIAELRYKIESLNATIETQLRWIGEIEKRGEMRHAGNMSAIDKFTSMVNENKNSVSEVRTAFHSNREAIVSLTLAQEAVAAHAGAVDLYIAYVVERIQSAKTEKIISFAEWMETMVDDETGTIN